MAGPTTHTTNRIWTPLYEWVRAYATSRHLSISAAMNLALTEGMTVLDPDRKHQPTK